MDLNSQSPTIILIMVMSANGVVAQKTIENSFEWNSEEDKKQFLQKVREIGTACMGSNTYRSIGGKPYNDVEFHVLSNRPDAFEPHDRVTFFKGDIETLVHHWRESGLKQVALLGGPQTNKLFFERGLVDEIYLTIEPTFMPEGMHMIKDLNCSIPLRLNNIEVLNQRKTLLLHYYVEK